MCSRFMFLSSPEETRELFGFEERPQFPPRYNIAPTQPVAIVRRGANGKRQFTLARWGLIPSWCKDPDNFAVLINARMETAREKPSFRAAMRHKRCLFPADGFIEWTGAKGAKQPHLIRPAAGGLMAFAGLWEHWMDAQGSEMETAAIITMPANRQVAALHDRMPALIRPDDFENWLDCLHVDAPEAEKLITAPEEDFFEILPLDPRINNPRFEGEIPYAAQGGLL